MTYAQEYRAFKKVFATVTSDIYGKFRKRALKEGIDMNDAFASLVTLYANGGMVTMTSKQKGSFDADWSYLKKGQAPSPHPTEKCDVTKERSDVNESE